jgi:hypothetical protein
MARIRGQIETDLADRAAWADKKSKELALQGKEKHNAAQIVEAQALAKEATEASHAHKDAVTAKDAAIKAQQQRNDDASKQGHDGAHRLAGMVVLEVPLKVFQGFTWIGAKLGSTKFAEMNQEANDFADKLAQMKKMVGGSSQATDANAQGIAKDAQTNVQTGQKNASTTAALTKNDTTLAQGKARVDGAVSKRGANAAQAQAQADKASGSAKTSQGEYASITGAMTAWAKAHQQARLDAKTASLAKSAEHKAEVKADAKPTGSPQPAGD